MRNITHHVARCAGYEFEDVIAQVDNVDVLAPTMRAEHGWRIARYARSLVFRDAPRIDGKLVVAAPYDLFFAFCLGIRDIQYLEMIEGLHEQCRTSICMIGELWPTAIAEARTALESLRRFDCIFSSLESSVDAIRNITGRPCYFLPFGIDTERFCPTGASTTRQIDVCNIGRRHRGVHDVLMARADRGDMLYIYDTAGDFSVLDVHQHRRLLANLVKHSRYFIAYPPKFDRPAETGGMEEIGTRYFEGAAGGAVMLGMPSRCSAFDACFDWPDAVVPAAADGRDILQVMAALESDPRRIERIRRDNIVNCLRRHDWLYRWREILDAAGLSEAPLMIERRERLKAVAADVISNGTALLSAAPAR